MVRNKVEPGSVLVFAVPKGSDGWNATTNTWRESTLQQLCHSSQQGIMKRREANENTVCSIFIVQHSTLFYFSPESVFKSAFTSASCFRAQQTNTRTFLEINTWHKICRALLNTESTAWQLSVTFSDRPTLPSAVGYSLSPCLRAL